MHLDRLVHMLAEEPRLLGRDRIGFRREASGKEGAHVFDELTCDGRRYFQLFPGHVALLRDPRIGDPFCYVRQISFDVDCAAIVEK